MIRLINDAANDGPSNMSIDQALLESTGSTCKPVLRLYRWVPATLSLGYFQPFNDRERHQASFNCPAVRRASGGGAIVHHHELTYSLCMPGSNRWSARHDQLYRTVHDCIVACLSEWSISAEAHMGEPKSSQRTPQNFLCFQRRFAGDLVMGEHKIVGSAQRRGRNAILQHGSILLSRSESAPELPGINDLADHALIETEFADIFRDRLCDALQLSGEIDRITQTESDLAEQISRDRFAAERWNRRL